MPYYSPYGTTSLTPEAVGYRDNCFAALVKRLIQLAAAETDDWAECLLDDIGREARYMAHACIPVLEQRYQEAGDVFRL